MNDSRTILHPRDLRVDTFQAGVLNGPWSISVTHIPSGIRVGPIHGRGPRPRPERLIAELAQAVAEANLHPVRRPS